MDYLETQNEAFSELLGSLKKENVVGGIEEILKLHPKKKFKYPSEERQKYSCLHDWYKQKIKSIQELLKKDKIHTEQAVKEKQQILLLTMRQYALFAYQQCEEKGCLINTLATHQLQFNNSLLKELDYLLKQNIEQRQIDHKVMEIQYVDKIDGLEQEVKTMTNQKNHKWKSMFLLIKDNRILRRGRGKLTRALTHSLNRQKRLQEDILDVTRENQKLKAILNMEDDISLQKIMANMISFTKLQKTISKFPNKAKKVLDQQLQGLEIDEMDSLPEKIEYITKAIDEAEQLVDYYEDLHDIISSPKLLLNAHTQIENETEEKSTNTNPIPIKINSFTSIKCGDLVKFKLTSQVYDEMIFPQPKMKRNNSQKAATSKRFTKTDFPVTPYSTNQKNQIKNSKYIQTTVNYKYDPPIYFSHKNSANESQQKNKIKRRFNKIKNVYSFSMNPLLFINNRDSEQNYSQGYKMSKKQKNKRKSYEKRSFSKRITLTEAPQYKMKAIIQQGSESSQQQLNIDENFLQQNTDQPQKQNEIKEKNIIRASKKTMSKVESSERSITTLKTQTQKSSININLKKQNSLKSPRESLISKTFSNKKLRQQTSFRETNTNRFSRNLKQNKNLNIVKTEESFERKQKYRLSGINYYDDKNKKANQCEIPSDNTITQSFDFKASSNDFEVSEKKFDDGSVKKNKSKKISGRISINQDLQQKYSPNHRLSTRRQFVPLHLKKDSERNSRHKVSGFGIIFQKDLEDNTSRRNRSNRGNIYFPHAQYNKENGVIKSFELSKLVQKILHNLFGRRKELQSLSTLPNFVFSYLKVFYGNNHQAHVNSFMRSLASEYDPTPILLVFMRLMNINVPWIYLKDLLRIYLVLLDKTSRENLIIERQIGEKIIDFVFSIFYKKEQRNEFITDEAYLQEKNLDLNEFFLNFQYNLYKHGFQTQFSVFCREILHPIEYDLNFSQLSQLTLFLNDNLSLELHLIRLRCFCQKNDTHDNTLPIHKISIYTVREDWTELKNIKTTVQMLYRKSFSEESDYDLINFVNRRFLLMKDECPWLLRVGRFHVKNHYRYNMSLNRTLLMLLRLIQLNLQIKRTLPIPESYNFITSKYKRIMIAKEVSAFKNCAQ